MERAWKKLWQRSLLMLACLGIYVAQAAYFGWNVPVGCANEELVLQTLLPAQASADSEVPEEKVVYLTFDDGPSATTEKVLDILKEEQVTATFFVIAADNNEKYLPLLERTVAEGHAVGLHSSTHSYKTIYNSTDAFWEDIEALRLAIAPYGCGGTMLLRFPGGSTNTVSHKYGGDDIMKTLKVQAEEQEYRYFDWNVCAEDAVGGHPSAQTIYNNVIRGVGDKTTCVVLMHDTAATKTTAEALPDIIAWFKNAGYRFDTLEHLDKRV